MWYVENFQDLVLVLYLQQNVYWKDRSLRDE